MSCNMELHVNADYSSETLLDGQWKRRQWKGSTEWCQGKRGHVNCISLEGRRSRFQSIPTDYRACECLNP
ncbi:hypothetical protein GCK32_015433 [Trichostrongylus colubriformis]|uniref:Uncharacterized protein n=1 Tax=Trichostrongylus colubriformis TaxID=6319 RepID=A0AAN8G2A4_TRICO